MLFGVAIAVGVLIAYANSLSGPIVFDDYATIIENASIRKWSDLKTILLVPSHLPVGGRPFANLTFALNYALGGTKVDGYHLVNLLIHIGAALALYGVLRRTFARRNLGQPSALAAFATAGWALHPLQTASVTYLSQRTESLMGLCYVLTLYSFIRATECSPRFWLVLSVTACALGMAAKESMATAPFVVLLYDRIFVAPSIKYALCRRRYYYILLGATWLQLGVSFTSGLVERGVGYGLGVTWWRYALTECKVIWLYLKLAVWPHPLIFDYGTTSEPVLSSTLPFALAILLLLGAAGFAVRRAPGIGFAAMTFFLLLAPTSSIVPLPLQPIAENRMYLPLAPLCALAALTIGESLGRRGMAIAGAALLGFVGLTASRNQVFRSEFTLWADNIVKRPQNPRGYDNYALALCRANQAEAAIPYLKHALALNPGSAPTTALLGNTYLQLDRLDDAATCYARAIRLNPALVSARNNLGVALMRSGHPREAIAQYEAALQMQPDNAEFHVNLGVALVAIGDFEPAVAHYELALRLDPNNLSAQNNYADLLAARGNYVAAAQRYERSLEIDGRQVSVHTNLASALVQLGQLQRAAAQCEQALRIDPRNAGAYNNYGVVLFRSGHWEDALVQFETALRIKPDFAEARENITDLRTAERSKAPPATPARP